MIERPWAEQMVKQAVDQAREGDPDEFAAAVLEGLRIGAEEYGEDNYLRFPPEQMGTMGREEARDLACYALFGWDLVTRSDLNEERRGEGFFWLARVLMLAAQVDFALTQFREAVQVERAERR